VPSASVPARDGMAPDDADEVSERRVALRDTPGWCSARMPTRASQPVIFEMGSTRPVCEHFDEKSRTFGQSRARRGLLVVLGGQALTSGRLEGYRPPPPREPGKSPARICCCD